VALTLVSEVCLLPKGVPLTLVSEDRVQPTSVPLTLVSEDRVQPTSVPLTLVSESSQAATPATRYGTWHLSRSETRAGHPASTTAPLRG